MGVAGLFLAGCFEHHGMTPEPPPEPPACIASAPVLVAPAGPGCASLELTVQDLPHAPLRRCALGAWAEERPVQPVYVANGGDTPIEVRVHHVSVDCGLGTRERCGGAADSTPDGCACGTTTFGPYELWERPPVEMRFVIEGEGSTIFVGGDRVTYRIDACRLPGPSDPFPIPTDCETVPGTGTFDPVECDGLQGTSGTVVSASEPCLLLRAPVRHLRGLPAHGARRGRAFLRRARHLPPSVRRRGRVPRGDRVRSDSWPRRPLRSPHLRGGALIDQRGMRARSISIVLRSSR
ncbi:MAG TPA: hypothetical protein VIL20_21560 [Sandaracinaceae bacterium]